MMACGFNSTSNVLFAGPTNYVNLQTVRKQVFAITYTV